MSTSAISASVNPDASLLDRASRGDESAVASLYDRYGNVLYAVAYRITRERADAEEAVLEAFAQAWRDAVRFSAERGSVAAWLTMIARSRALDIVRARTRREKATTAAAFDAAATDTAPGMGAWDDDPSAAVIRTEQAVHVRAALRELSAPQRQVIELAFYEGLSHSEIAERLSEPLGTVKTRIRLGMQKLREALRALFQDQAP